MEVTEILFRTDHVESVKEKGHFLTSDLVLVEYNKIINFFILTNCSTIANKPKYLFLIVAAAKEVDPPYVIFEHYTTCYALNSTTPIYQDCIVISSSTSGDSSWGTKNEGTVKPPTSGPPSSGHLDQPGNIFV